jgi:hypothetical protein
MKEQIFLGLSSACWIQGADMGIGIVCVIFLLLIAAGIIYAIYGSIKKTIEHNEYIKHIGLNNTEIKEDKEEKMKEFKDGIIGTLKGIGLSVLIALGVSIYFWIISMIIKMMGRCA